MSAIYARPFAAQSTRITTATTTAVKSSTGTIVGILVGTTAAGTITVNDANGTKAVLKVSIPEGFYPMGFECVGKIEVVTAAASDITVVYD